MIDTHAHVTLKQFDKDFDQIMHHAKAAKVNKIINICLSEKDFLKAQQKQKKYKNLYLTLGFHPADINDYQENNQFLVFLEQEIINQSIIAVGEIGLDYHWVKDEDGQKKQKELFKKQIELAQKYKLPICIHSRNANDDTYNILKKYAPIQGVMHSFSGNYEEAKKFIDLGMFIGISGIVTFKNNKKTQDLAKLCPLNKIIIETDCPFLTPHPYRGDRNEPAYVQYVAQAIAKFKDISMSVVDNATTSNAEALFRIDSD